jgi:oligopeptide transport system permease protein
MFRFILRRLIVTVPMVLIVISLTWGLIRLAPGNFYSGEKKLPPAVEKNVREKYGLDKPWYVQYGRVLGGILGFKYDAARAGYSWKPYPDFGNSLKYENESVNDILWRTLPVSAVLGVCAYLLALAVGVTMGTLAALRQNSRLDYASMAVAMLGISLPNFVLGPILVLVFALSLYWLPPARWGGFPSWNLVLPVLTLSAVYMAYIARLTRSGMLEVLRSDYIRTARAKGLSERHVVVRHAMRGGLLPVVSFTGPALALLIAGTVVTERIFAMPGLGNYFINANLNRDEPLIIGIVAFISITILIFNLLVDIAYAFLDPRIRY